MSATAFRAGWSCWIRPGTREERLMSDISVNANTKPKIPTAPSPSITTDAPETGNPISQFPILLHGLSEQQAERAREHWQTMKSANEKLPAMVRDSYSTASTETVDYGLKVMA